MISISKYQYDKWSDSDYCFNRIKQNPWTLEFVKNQTDEMCLTAVKLNGYCLQFVKNQTDEIVSIACKQHPMAYELINQKEHPNLYQYCKLKAGVF